MAKPDIVEVPGVRALGPYSHAVKAGGLVFVSGQAGIGPATGTKGGTFAEQGRQAFEKLRAVLEAAGSGMDRVVNTTCLLGDIGYFPELNAFFAEYFAASPPARMAMQVPLPMGLLFSIDPHGSGVNAMHDYRCIALSNSIEWKAKIKTFAVAMENPVEFQADECCSYLEQESFQFADTVF